MPEGELVDHLNEIHDAGYQMGIHAIGDAAIVLVVNTLADALERNPREDHRHYLNHFSMRPPELTMELMAEHSIHITQQPTTQLEGRYAENLDGWRLQHNNPLRGPMDHGITVAISSDMLIGPLVGIYAAVTAKGATGTVYGADEAISMEEAIRAYTALGAYLNFEEDKKGTLEVGKFADMVLLSEDLLSIAPERIMEWTLRNLDRGFTGLRPRLAVAHSAQPEDRSFQPISTAGPEQFRPPAPHRRGADGRNEESTAYSTPEAEWSSAHRVARLFLDPYRASTVIQLRGRPGQERFSSSHTII